MAGAAWYVTQDTSESPPGSDPGPSAPASTAAAGSNSGEDPVAPTSGSTVPPRNAETATVLRVDDGDSIFVRVGGAEAKVRLVGINAPERDECMDAEAKAALRDLIDGREVTLEADEDPVDQFDRLLRYVWVDGLLVNAELAEQGLVIARAFPPNTARHHELEAAEDRAQSTRVGIWDPSSCGGVDADLAITEVVADPRGRDEANLNGEYVVVLNRGHTAVDLSEFVLRDGSSIHRYEFPAGFVLEAAHEVTVHVGCGDDSRDALFWCRGTPVWDNSGDQAFLLTPAGAYAATYEYGE